MIQSVTTAVNSINADSALLRKIIFSQQKSNAKKFLINLRQHRTIRHYSNT